MRKEMNSSVVSEVKGSPAQAFIVNASLAFTGVAPLALHAVPLATMTKLSPALYALLACSPLISTAAIQPIADHYINGATDGGRKANLVLRSIQLLGPAAAMLLSGLVDITEINSFDGPLAILFGAGVISGIGSGAFQEIMNTLKQTTPASRLPARLSPTSWIPIRQAGFASIADSAKGITSLVMPWVAESKLGLTGVYGGFFLINLIGAISIFFIQPSPEDQYRKKYSDVEAAIKAVEYGQPKELLRSANYVTWKEKLKDQIGLRPLALNFMFCLGLGGYFVSSISYISLLKLLLKISLIEASMVGAAASLVGVGSRAIGGFLISGFDHKTGGVWIAELGALLVAISATASMIVTPSRETLYPSMGLMSVGMGLLMAVPFQLAQKWANPENKRYKSYDTGAMIANIGTTATFFSCFLIFVLSLTANDTTAEGYKGYFGLVFGMAVLAALLTVPTHLSVNNKLKWDLFRCHVKDNETDLVELPEVMDNKNDNNI